MSKISAFFKNNSNNIKQALMFTAAIVILFYIFLKRGKFKYEFQKGKAWKHKSLYAEFDYPMYKTDTELQGEQDTIMQVFRPYFLIDTSVYEMELSSLNSSFSSYTKTLSTNKFAKTEKLQKQILEIIHNNLNVVYSQGIMQSDDFIQRVKNANDNLYLVKNNIAEERSASNIFTQVSAYNYIKDSLQFYVNILSTDNRVLAREIIDEIKIDKHILPNLKYDESKSNSEKKALTDNVSLTIGMVQEGELIVQKGELVTGETYRKLESLKKDYEARLGEKSDFNIILLGQFIIVFMMIFLLYTFFFNFRKELLDDSMKVAFILFYGHHFYSFGRLILQIDGISIYILPCAVLPVIIRSFYDSRIAIFTHLIVTLILGFWVSNSYQFVLLTFTSGVIGIFSLTTMYKRSKFFLSSAVITFSYSILYFGISITQTGSIKDIDFYNFMWFAINGTLVVFVSYPLIYIFEKLFGFVSEFTLFELCDTNNPLLKAMAEQAPGTFQHSMQVANLAEQAIRSLNGNPLLIRAGALYHDVGKIAEPIYFTENQRQGNPHNDLTPIESAKKIVDHIQGGVVLAKKHNIPKQVIDFIVTHQGTSKVHYFMRKYQEDHDNIDESLFQYPGPKPFSKETAVLMMADSIEAASRSLPEYSSENISNLVDSIIDNYLQQGQFSDAPLTFKDVTTVKEVFKEKLRDVYHVRIAYPK